MFVTRVEKLSTVAPGEGGRFRVFAFDVEVTVRGDVDPAHGMVVNLAAVKESLRREIVAPLDGRCLDGREGAPDLRTPEALARAIWGMLGGRLAGREIHRVRLAGRPSPVVDCFGGDEMDVTRVYEFSASHRLHSPALSERENARVFGKCNNPRGHGHNYVLEVTLRGRPGESGELLAADEFDRIVGAEVVDRWDHKNLNEDLPEFRDRNPTAEEIARIAWERLRKPLGAAAGGASLHRIKLRETERNHVEYFGD